MSGILVKGVSFGYEKNRNILTDITFSAKAGESVGIIGSNGVGKSTLLKMMVGLLSGYTGEIIVSDVCVERKNLESVRKKVGYVFQDSDSQLFMTTVYDDIAFAPRNYGFSEAEVRQRVEEAMRMTGTTNLMDKQIYKLSGGEKKLVSIATILSMMPEIILMDEPTTALDPRNRRRLIHLLNSFEQLKVIASHDLDFIWDTCQRTILIAGGKVVCDGPTKEVLSNQQLMEENGLELPLRFARPY